MYTYKHKGAEMNITSDKLIRELEILIQIVKERGGEYDFSFNLRKLKGVNNGKVI